MVLLELFLRLAIQLVGIEAAREAVEKEKMKAARREADRLAKEKFGD